MNARVNPTGIHPPNVRPAACAQTKSIRPTATTSAHARRKVFDAREAYPLESSAVLAKFQQLYDLEDRAKTWSIDQRLA